jgi:hypothetical protein
VLSVQSAFINLFVFSLFVFSLFVFSLLTFNFCLSTFIFLPLSFILNYITMIRKTLFPLLLLITFTANAQLSYTPAPENLKAREWFQDARFGLFIHWGVYSVLCNGEWVMNNQQIDKKTYEKSGRNEIYHDHKQAS